MKRKQAYWLIPLIVIILYFTVGVKAGIYSSATTTTEDSINIPIYMLDSLGRPVLRATGDSLWVITYYPGGYQITADSCRILSDAKIIHRQLNIRGLTTSMMTYRNSITALDGTVQNGTYKYLWVAYDSSLNLTTTGTGEFQVYTTTTFSALSNGQKYDNDSLTFNGVLQNPSFLRPTTAGRTLDVTATGEAGIDLDNTAGTLAKTSDITGFNDIAAVDPWNVAFGTAFTGGSMGDSLNGMQYSKLSQLIVANVDAQISSRGTSTYAPATDSVIVDRSSLILGRGNHDSTYYNALQDSIWLADSADYYNDPATMGKSASATAASSFNPSSDSVLVKGAAFAALNSVINSTNIAENAISGAKIAPSAAATIAYYCRDSVKVVVNDSIMPHLYSLLAAGGGLWPIIGGPILIDAAGSNPTTRFVIDTTSLLAYSSSGYGLIRKVFIIHKAGSQVVPFTVTSVRFNTSGSCTLYTDRTMPFSFATGDTIWPTGLPWEYFASIEEQSLSNWDEVAVNHTTPGTYGYDIPAQIATRSTFDPLADTVTWVDSVISSIGATSGSGTGAYACTLYVRDVGTAIPSAIIQVNNADETASLASHQADGNGRWIFNLDSGYVNVRIHYPNATQGTNPQSVHVTSAGANDTIQITILEGLKTLFLMTLQDNQGALSGAYVQFELLNVPKGDIAIDTTIGSALTGTKFVTNANAGGVISQDLFRNCNIKFARSGEFNKTEWLVKAVRLGRSLENPDLEFKFKISSNDSTYFRPSGD